LRQAEESCHACVVHNPDETDGHELHDFEEEVRRRSEYRISPIRARDFSDILGFRTMGSQRWPCVGPDAEADHPRDVAGQQAENQALGSHPEQTAPNLHDNLPADENDTHDRVDPDISPSQGPIF